MSETSSAGGVTSATWSLIEHAVTPLISCVPTVYSDHSSKWLLRPQQVKSCCAAPQVKKVSESAGEKSSAKVEGKRLADSDNKKSVAKKVKTLL